MAPELTRRHDHGSRCMSDLLQEESRCLGIASSPVYVRESKGNGCAERFVLILKEHLLWVRAVTTGEKLRIALKEFRRIYNETSIVGSHSYKTPA